MKIIDFLKPEAVLANLDGRTSTEVLAALCQPLSAAGDPSVLLEALLKRELLGSTAVGGGFAIPHAKVAGLPGLMAAFGRAPAGVDFGALDRLPVQLFFLLLAPEGSAGAHLKALARISRVFKSHLLREALLAAPTAGDLHLLIAAADEDAP